MYTFLHKKQLSIEQFFFEICKNVHFLSLFLARNHEFLYNKTVDYCFINYFCTFCVNFLCNNILFMHKNYRPSIFSVLLQLKDLILLKELNWLPLQSRITYHVALLVFKIHNDLAPNYLNTILLFTSNSLYELRSESRCHLAQPKKKSYYSNLAIQSLSTPIGTIYQNI